MKNAFSTPVRGFEEHSFSLGGQYERRGLSAYIVMDTSKSMESHGKNQAANYATEKSIRALQELQDQHPHIEITFTTITFDEEARIHTPRAAIADVHWEPVKAEGRDTLFAPAIDLLTRMMEELEGRKQFAPVIILYSDGLNHKPFEKSVETFLLTKWGKRAVRIAIAIEGDQGECDLDQLRKFMSDPEHEPLIASDADQLANHIIWAIHTVSESVVLGTQDKLEWPDQSTVIEPAANN